MPSQPRSPSFFENAGSTPDSQVSTCVRNEPAASSCPRNSRTSARTCSAASDRGAGASVNDEVLMGAPCQSEWRVAPAGQDPEASSGDDPPGSGRSSLTTSLAAGGMENSAP